YAFPEHAVRALGKIASYAAWRRRPDSLYWDFEDLHIEDARALCRRALAERGDGWLTSAETTGVLHAFGLPMVASSVAHTPDEAEAIAAVLGYPVAAKLLSAGLLHKSDIGGVRLGLATAAAVRDACSELLARARDVATDAAVEGVLIQSMVDGGIET